jgi:hypothetical protein
MWLKSQADPSTMGHLRITAAKTLKFEIETVIFPELAHDLEILEDLTKRFFAMRQEIEAGLSALPELLDSELHPIAESHRDK